MTVVPAANPPAGVPTPPRAYGGEGWLVLDDLVSSWRRSVVSLGIWGLLATALSFLMPLQYSSRASFMPESPDQSTRVDGLLGLASQLGVGLAGNSGTPQFYAELARSVSVTDSVLSTRVTAEGGASLTLAQFLRKGASANSPDWEKARSRLLLKTSATVNPRTNVIELQVLMPSPVIAQLVATRYVDELNRFNRASRHTSAQARREFVGRRVDETLDSLSAAENASRRFLESNRSYTNSPGLRFEMERLQRRLLGFQDLFQLLRREYETARLDEVNDQPLLTPIDAPSLPARPVSAQRAMYLVLGVAVGLVVVLLRALARVTMMRLLVTDPSRYGQMRAAIGHLPLVRDMIRSAERMVGGGVPGVVD